MDQVKHYWLREEIPIADELLALAPALTEEFLAYHVDFDGVASNLKPYVNKLYNPLDLRKTRESWLVDALKYTHQDADISYNHFKTTLLRNRFPTAVALTEKYGNDCPISTYSILNSNSVIERHTGFENRDNLYLRIHIPLIVPPGDIFFECEGIEIDWTDIWGFNNQLVHSAHNPTPKKRLVYLIDIRRERLVLPPEHKFDPEREKGIPKFVRGALPKVLHKHQRENSNV
jgi:hypothetical protein